MNEPLLGPKWTKDNKHTRSNLGTLLRQLRQRKADTDMSYVDLRLESVLKALPYGTFVRFVKTGYLPTHWKKQLNLVDKISYQRSCNMIDPISTADTLEGYMHEINLNKLTIELQKRGYGETTGDASNTIGVRRKD